MTAGSRPLYGTLLVAGAALCWSSAGLLSRLVSTDSWTTLFWRSLTGAIFLFLAIWVARPGRLTRAFRTLLGTGFVIVLLQATASVAFIFALMNTTVAATLIILATSPLFAALLARVFLGERVRPRTTLATLAALGGIVLMVSAELAPGSLFGNAMALVAATCFAGVIVTMRRHREVELVPAVCASALLSALVALPVAGQDLAVGPRDLGLLTLFGMAEQGLGLLLFSYGVRHVPSVEVAFIALLESILAPVWVWLAIGEEPGPRTLAGAGVVVAALLLNILADFWPPRPLRRPTR
jgi:drug/metabolite transporter (DMT)-like permease